jgi:hypothetical protein
MAHYFNKIRHLYPTALPEDFILEDVGSGSVLSYWNTQKLGVQPTLASIDTQISDSEIESYQRWKIIRAERDKLLKGSDYLILADAPVDETQKQEWATYRQALRDIPQNYDSPDEVVYPTKPK